ncbi:MAG: acetate--CoA ligase family protein [Firmicutes bacterium]|nr:acetate--CoA ligase family protein [Bacillota bacterium]
MRSFFSPQGCAVVGASRDPGKPGHQMLRSMLDAGFPPERLFPVNPGETEIAGLDCYPSLRDIPPTVELAVLMVPPRALDAVLADVSERARSRGDLKALIVTAGGFAELGTPEGRERQERLVRAVREAGVRLMGPNCIGVIDTTTRVDTTFLHGVVHRPGPVAFVSQSGAVGAWFVQMMSSEPEPAGFSKLVSLGNMADVTVAETLEFLRDDPETGVVGLYLEGTSEPRRLLRAIAALTPLKPVVVLKTGRTRAGGAAATSHTGALAGPDLVWDGALRQVGALRATTMEEFVDTLRLLGRTGGRPVRRTPARVFLVTHAGGPGVYTMDLLADRAGLLEPAVVGASTREALRATVPPLSSVCRPEGHLDMTASATAEQHREAIRLLLADPGVDAVVALDLPIRFLGDEEVAGALAEAWREARATGAADKLFLPVLMHGRWSERGRALLERTGVTALPSPDRAVAALANAARLGVLAPDAAAERWDEEAHRGAGRDGDGGLTLSETESAALLAACGVTFAPSRLARWPGTGGGAPSGIAGAGDGGEDPEARLVAAAVAAAEELGYPVVLKLCSRRIPHKAAVGGVRVGLAGPDAVAGAARELLGRAGEILGEGPAGLGALDGLLVQAQAEPGREVIVGGLRDPVFGPVVACGPGGTRVGADAPLGFRLAPLSEEAACRLAEEALGPGAAASLDLDVVARLLVGLGDLLARRPDILEADLNPVIVYPPGRGAVAVDALVRVGGGQPREGPRAGEGGPG